MMVVLKRWKVKLKKVNCLPLHLAAFQNIIVIAFQVESSKFIKKSFWSALSPMHMKQQPQKEWSNIENLTARALQSLFNRKRQDLNKAG